MQRPARLVLALLIAFPQAASAAAVTRGRLGPAPIAPAIPSLGAAPGVSLAVPGLTPAAPSLAPAPLSAPALSVPALQPSAVPSAAALPEAAALPASAVPAAPAPAAEAAQAPKSALERLQAEVPFEQPKASDLQGQKEFADESFAFKLGEGGRTGPQAVGPESIGRRGGRAPVGPSPSADDGGGPNYPHRTVEYNGKKFPSVVFRPNAPIEPLIVQAIDSAKKTLRIALYEFKQRSVLEALLRAKARGVDVKIVMDYSNVFPYNGPDADYRRERSWETWGLIRDNFDLTVLRGDGLYGIMHNKFVVVDGELAEFGSYNWSWAAENAHYENAQFTTDKARIQALTEYWDYLRGLSQPLKTARYHKWPDALPKPPASKIVVDYNGVKLPGFMAQPSGSFEEEMVKAIQASKKSIDVSIFALRSTKIAEALAAAHKRGLKVRVIIDRSQHDSEAFGVYTQWLGGQGIEVRILAGPDPEAEFQLAQKDHHKIAIFDGKLVETGSPNFTKAASYNNFDNGHFLDDATDVAGYRFIYDHMWQKATPYAPPSVVPALPTDEELQRVIDMPVPQRPVVDKPAPQPLPSAKEVKFNGISLPSSALLPEVPIEPLIIKAIDASKKTLRVAMYEFRQPGVLEALRRAKKRGVKIEIIIDRGHVYTTGKSHDGVNYRKPSAEIIALIQEGFAVTLLKGQGSGIMHNKLIIYDDKMAHSGSYNLTDWAEANHYENVTFTNAKDEVADLKAYFRYMRGLSEEVDMDKFDDILNRAAGTESGVSDTEAAGQERDSKFPAPPVSKAAPVAYNGETFARFYFSPQGGIEDALIRAIKAAKTSIDVAMFSFYSKALADALLEARDRGIKVRIVLDNSQSKMAKLDDWFAYHGFDVVLLAGPNDPENDDSADPMFEKMHNKYMIVDGKLLANGSFNYSPNAENNSFENVRFVDDALDLARFVESFSRMYARGWKPKAPPKEPKFDAPRAGAESTSDESAAF